MSKWIGYIGLCVGVFILLFSIQMFVNIQHLLKEKNVSKGGYDFISISRTITNENMGRNNKFSDPELDSLTHAPTVVGISPLITNQFSVTASAGSMLAFSSELFLESVDREFIDTLPPDFSWQPGQSTVPVIFSSDYLEMYNVFAPAQGLPQLSQKTISSVNLLLQCSGTRGSENFRGNIVALSDRINSVLVPQNFLEWCNENLAGVTKVEPSRVLIKTKDANDVDFVNYLDRHNLHVNKEKIKFGRAKGILQSVLSGLLGFGLLVVVLALILFSFFLQLMIARSRENLKLLIELGYSPAWLVNRVSRSWAPIYTLIIVTGCALVMFCQYLISASGIFLNAGLTPFPAWEVILAGTFLIGIALLVNRLTLKQAIGQIS